jgi:hypothetical protein
MQSAHDRTDTIAYNSNTLDLRVLLLIVFHVTQKDSQQALLHAAFPCWQAHTCVFDDDMVTTTTLGVVCQPEIKVPVICTRPFLRAQEE